MSFEREKQDWKYPAIVIVTVACSIAFLHSFDPVFHQEAYAIMFGTVAASVVLYFLPVAFTFLIVGWLFVGPVGAIIGLLLAIALSLAAKSREHPQH